MTDRPHEGAIDYERLGDYFRALSVPTRIQLLHKLQVPQAAGEILLPPFRRSPDQRHDRPLARQTVDTHLKQLEEVGLVRTRQARRGGQAVREYIVNQPRLFAMVEDLRRLARIRPAPGLASPGTHTGRATGAAASNTAPPALGPGPALVLVSGPFEGKAFPLEGSGPWIVGRAKDAEVPLEYDPFVSAANAEIRRERGHHAVRDLPGSRNGTEVNWRRLGGDERTALVPGDTLGVGRSLLVFRTG